MIVDWLWMKRSERTVELRRPHSLQSQLEEVKTDFGETLLFLLSSLLNTLQLLHETTIPSGSILFVERHEASHFIKDCCQLATIGQFQSR
jgi:hypothetical protein